MEKTDTYWRETLDSETYRILRKGGTERAFSHPYYQEKRSGIYACAGCGTALFSSTAKYDSGTGWPSFYQPTNPQALREYEDKSLFMRRTEVRCATCEGHLGHVFTDGPKPTGLRYCINGQALCFKED